MKSMYSTMTPSFRLLHDYDARAGTKRTPCGKFFSGAPFQSSQPLRSTPALSWVAVEEVDQNRCDGIVGDCMVLALQLFFLHSRDDCGDGIDGSPGPGRARTTVDSERGSLNVRQLF